MLHSCAQQKGRIMLDWLWNPNGESGFSGPVDPRLPGNHPTTLGARGLSATGAQPSIM